MPDRIGIGAKPHNSLLDDDGFDEAAPVMMLSKCKNLSIVGHVDDLLLLPLYYVEEMQIAADQ